MRIGSDSLCVNYEKPITMQVLFQTVCFKHTESSARQWDGLDKFLQALGVPYKELQTCDVKPNSFEFVEKMCPSAHHFRDLADLLQAPGQLAWCCKHQTMCPTVPPLQADLLVSGPPCSPFTAQRNQRFRGKGCQPYSVIYVASLGAPFAFLVQRNNSDLSGPWNTFSQSGPT